MHLLLQIAGASNLFAPGLLGSQTVAFLSCGIRLREVAGMKTVLRLIRERQIGDAAFSTTQSYSLGYLP
jgi:hypothetical protein